MLLTKQARRSATQSIRLGYTAIDARIGVDGWLQASESFNLNLSTKILMENLLIVKVN